MAHNCNDYRRPYNSKYDICRLCHKLLDKAKQTELKKAFK